MAEEDQERILEDHIQVVREQAFHMKKSLDQNNLRDALKFSSTMLGEMKTSRLSPRNYFNLCKSPTQPQFVQVIPVTNFRVPQFFPCQDIAFIPFLFF
jgi:hypothetical protein